jgi:hypothetical protein
MTGVLALVFVGAFIYFPDTLNGQAMAATAAARFDLHRR